MQALRLSSMIRAWRFDAEFSARSAPLCSSRCTTILTTLRDTEGMKLNPALIQELLQGVRKLPLNVEIRRVSREHLGKRRAGSVDPMNVDKNPVRFTSGLGFELSGRGLSRTESLAPLPQRNPRAVTCDDQMIQKRNPHHFTGIHHSARKLQIFLARFRFAAGMGMEQENPARVTHQGMA